MIPGSFGWHCADFCRFAFRIFKAQSAKIGWQRAGRRNRRLLSARNCQAGRVKHGPPGTLARAIDRIAKQRQAKARGGMDPDLVGAAGFRPEF